MDALAYDLVQMTGRNRHGSFATRENRRRTLLLAAKELREEGYRLPGARSLKPKHVEALLKRWRKGKLADATLKNRMAVLRWWADRVQKPGLIASDNESYGIAERSTFKGNRAQKLNLDKLAAIECAYMRMSLRLMAAFGLREEEALKFTPSMSIRDNRIVVLKGTKGGRLREVPILTARQRALLDEALALAPSGSLVPVETYVKHKKAFEYRTLKAGLTNLHGLRHNYAQWRYLTLTGWACPAAGGPQREDMTRAECERDRMARDLIAEELGHGRRDVTKAYLG